MTGSLRNNLLSYLPTASRLLYQPPDHIQATIQILINQITEHAALCSPYYNVSRSGFIISKSDLTGSDWWFEQYQHARASTGGGATGNGFKYLRWNEIYDQIEGDLHYREILNEFGICNNPKIVVLFLDEYHPTWLLQKNDNHLIYRHGADDATVWYVRRDGLYSSDKTAFYQRLLDFMASNQIDILLGGGYAFLSLRYYAEKLHFKGKLAHLLSNTYERLPHADVLWLQNNGFIDVWCDHMRCWDGGATFITCRFGTYHLLDNVSYVISAGDKMVSTDYFSIASPFVKYWNGDYCRVINQYFKCECGRYYRPFRLIRPRSILTNNVINEEILAQINTVGIRCVKSLKIDGSNLELTTTRALSEAEIDALNHTTGLHTTFDVQS